MTLTLSQEAASEIRDSLLSALAILDATNDEAPASQPRRRLGHRTIEKPKTGGAWITLASLIFAIIVGTFVYNNLSPNEDAPQTAATEQSAKPMSNVEKQALVHNCYLAYERMCRDETEVFWASLRSGMNEGLRGK